MYTLLLPEIVLLCGGLLVLAADWFISSERKRILAYVTCGVLLATLIAISAVSINARVGLDILPFWIGLTYTMDSFAVFFKNLVVIAVGLVVLLSVDFVDQRVTHGRGEFYAFLIFSALGLVLMAGSTDLIMIYLSMEFVSITSYILAGYLRRDAKSAEAGIKYFLMGAISSAVMLYGMSLLYGITGALELSHIGQVLGNGSEWGPILPIALVMMLAGFGFKIAMVPFHAWCPDVYEGAPTPITAFFSVGPKAAGFAVLIRVLLIAFGSVSADWMTIIAVLSAMTMTLGNLAALPQTNIKRMLAYSSIAQAGYILIGLAAEGPEDMRVPGMMIYLLAYIFTNIGAFAVVLILSNAIHSHNIEDYAGMVKRAPAASIALVVFFLSLAGIPPLAGFIGKFYVFAAAIDSGLAWLAIIGVINSVISVYYYFNVIRYMFFVKGKSEETLPQYFTLNVALLLVLIATIAIGVYPQPFLNLIQGSVQMFTLTGP